MTGDPLPYHVYKTIDGAHTAPIGCAATFRDAIQMAIEWHEANGAASTEIYGPGSHSMGYEHYWRHLADFIDGRAAGEAPRPRAEETPHA